jgi:integral membrane sensor domain MASE1
MARKAIARAVAFLLLALLAAPAAFACPVCVGDTDSQMAQGTNNGILFLLGIVLTVQAAFVALFVGIRRRARRLEQRRADFRLIEGGAR